MFGVEKSFFIGLSVAIFFSNWIAAWTEEKPRPLIRIVAFFVLVVGILTIISYSNWPEMIGTWILFFVTFGFMKFVFFLHERERRLAAEKKDRKRMN